MNYALEIHDFITKTLKCEDQGGGDANISGANAFVTRYKGGDVVFDVYFQTIEKPGKCDCCHVDEKR